MRVNSIGANMAFGKIYTAYGSKGRMTRLENVLSSKEANYVRMGYVDATDVFKNINVIRSMDEVKLRNTAQQGGMAGFILTDEDADELEFIDKFDEDMAHALSRKSGETICIDNDNIKNIF
ncbi:hypothetical protein IJ531_01650 [bacterium]|nr:hypothetical protein [bacterium]